MKASGGACLLAGFHDPKISAESWNDLLPQGNTDTLFLTYAYQKAWWQVYGRGQLLLVAWQEDGEIVTIAPLFADSGMIFFTGSGGSDYLDFIGAINPDRLAMMLDVASAAACDFIGFRFYHIRQDSITAAMIEEAAGLLGWQLFLEDETTAPALVFKDFSGGPQKSYQKKSLIRHERWLEKNGGLEVQHYSSGSAIRPYLEELYGLHMARWKETPYPSLFEDKVNRDFYRTLCDEEVDWLRYSRVLWKGGQLVSSHFGFHYKGCYLWYKPAFQPALAKRSPGEVLIRQLLIRALEEGAHTFDFGLGDEGFKSRFATENSLVQTWGLYPPDKIMKHGK